MRLICPNCGAQYEVEDQLIPAEGRDVQCSNCGTTWFHDGVRRAGARPPAAPETEAEVEADPAPQEAPPEVAPATPAPEPEPAPAPRASTAGIDLDILREEAEQEARLRAGLSGAIGLETQPDLGLEAAEPDTAPRPRRVRRAVTPEAAEPTPEPEQPADVPPPQAEEDTVIAPPATPPEGRPGGSRRDLLPDIEEINSTLRPSARIRRGHDSADVDDPELAAENGRGMRRGFVLMTVILSFFVLFYAFGPKLAEAVPATAPVVASYRSWVDVQRVRLDAAVGAIADRLSEAAATEE